MIGHVRVSDRQVSRTGQLKLVKNKEASGEQEGRSAAVQSVTYLP